MGQIAGAVIEPIEVTNSGQAATELKLLEAAAEDSSKNSHPLLLWYSGRFGAAELGKQFD